MNRLALRTGQVRVLRDMRSAPHPPPPLLGVLLALTLGGCTLIDQTTFAPDPEPPGPQQISAAATPDRRVPLLTIRYDVPNPSYEELLRYAVQAARARDAAIDFDVVSVVPGPGGGAGVAQAGQAGRADAADVMRTMMRLGVPDTSIRLGARSDAAATVREVRVYVR
jgi:hypothetical protein